MFLDLYGAEWSGFDTYEIRQDARRFENWESNKALTLGMKAAADYATSIGMHNIWERIQSLATTYRERLEQNVEGLSITDTGRVKGGIVTFTIEGYDCDTIKDFLFSKKINVSVSHKSSTYLDMDSRGLKAVVRSSVHYYNNEEDLDRLVVALNEFLKS
jgi:selenocysteine lyase/cysteine desulfurase